VKKATIALEDGTLFEGRAFVGDGEVYGELVFNTSMTGYQEILTDPSYHGQIVTLTYPLIGNYGTNSKDIESWKPHCAALVVGECSRITSNWQSEETLPAYLDRNGLIGVDQIDTRAITLHIRSKGAMKCVLSTVDHDPESLVAKAKASEGLVGRDLSSEVSTDASFSWRDKAAELGEPIPEKSYDFKVAVYDCGVKYNQLRILNNMGCDLRIFPLSATSDEILAWKPDGLFVSNGPGDPAGVKTLSSNIRKLVDTGLPTFGICFGHQMMARAFGGQTFKLKFGHRGGNQPVMDLTTGKVEITSQNHGFCVDKDSLPDDVETTHINLNDQTSEGLRHKTLPMFTVQYHPEAAPGPHDAQYLFQRFIELMKEHPVS
jgi:carbamoyl-phosphate synthase small subunit